MKSFVIGASGQVGGAIVSSLEEKSSLEQIKDQEVVGTYALNRPEHLDLVHLDITSSADVDELLAVEAPAHVYLCSSYTNVDGCERDEARSRQVNVDGVVSVVAACRRYGHKLIYFSSDYIFDGKDGPYTEKSSANPISVYGRHKVEAESHVQDLPESLILRTTVVYGQEWQGKNFIARLIKTLKDGQGMSVPDDQVGNPTYAQSLGAVSCLLAQNKHSGIFNVAGVSRVSRYQFALDAAEIFALDGRLLKPVSTAQLGQPAARPLSGGLVMDKVLALYPGSLPGHKEGLALLKKQLESSN